MSEHIISDKCLDYIRARSYEAGQRGQEVYTVRGADGEEVVRCQDCRKSDPKAYDYCEFFHANGRNPNGFCAWGERDT